MRRSAYSRACEDEREKGNGESDVVMFRPVT